MERYPQAEAFIRLLNEQGVDYIFFNPGLDTAPIQATAAQFRDRGEKAPQLVLCLDEAVAMAAAHGHYMVSGKPQVVLVHCELGTLQIGGALTNAQRGRIPVIICAGTQSGAGRKTWRGEAYDQGSIVRNCVKWDYEVKNEENAADALQKMFHIALTEPRGPVYLATSIQSLYATSGEIATPAAIAGGQSSRASAELLAEAADILIAARNPLILTGYSGRNAGSVSSLVRLAETLSARVLSGPTRMNFPTTHPLFSGMDPIAAGTRGSGKYISECDALLAIDYDLPYAAGPFRPPETAKIVYIDLDTCKKSSPMWGHAPDVFIEADSAEAIPALRKTIEKKLSAEKRMTLTERYRTIEQENQKLRRERHEAGLKVSFQKPISSDWLCRCLAQVVEPETIIVNQTITHSASVAEQIDRTLPGTFLSCAGGSIGWPLGAALGAKIAAPESTVVALMGDGAYVWGCPTASLWGSRAYNAPFLSVIFNNQAYAAIKGIVQRAYGDEKVSVQKGFEAGVNIVSPPDYAMIARACGAFGVTVRQPEEVLPSLRKAIEYVHTGQAAVVDVLLA